MNLRLGALSSDTTEEGRVGSHLIQALCKLAKEVQTRLREVKQLTQSHTALLSSEASEILTFHFQK